MGDARRTGLGHVCRVRRRVGDARRCRLLTGSLAGSRRLRYPDIDAFEPTEPVLCSLAGLISAVIHSQRLEMVAQLGGRVCCVGVVDDDHVFQTPDGAQLSVLPAYQGSQGQFQMIGYRHRFRPQDKVYAPLGSGHSDFQVVVEIPLKVALAVIRPRCQGVQPVHPPNSPASAFLIEALLVREVSGGFGIREPALEAPGDVAAGAVQRVDGIVGGVDVGAGVLPVRVHRPPAAQAGVVLPVQGVLGVPALIGRMAGVAVAQVWCGSAGCYGHAGGRVVKAGHRRVAGVQGNAGGAQVVGQQVAGLLASVTVPRQLSHDAPARTVHVQRLPTPQLLHQRSQLRAVDVGRGGIKPGGRGFHALGAHTGIHPGNHCQQAAMQCN